MTLTAIRERLRSPATTAIRNAGPPEWQTVVAAVVGGALDLVILWTAPFVPPLWLYLAAPAACCLVVALSDRQGWAIREAMATVAVEQRRRWTGRSLPTTPSTADQWLADPANRGASPAERATVLVTAERFADAREAVAEMPTETSLDRVRIARMQWSLAAALDDRQEPNLGDIRPLLGQLEPNEARFQLLSAAWTRAWLDIRAGRPWRERLGAVALELRPYPLPLRVRVAIGIQELAAPIAIVIAGAIVWGILAAFPT